MGFPQGVFTGGLAQANALVLAGQVAAQDFKLLAVRLHRPRPASWLPTNSPTQTCIWIRKRCFSLITFLVHVQVEVPITLPARRPIQRKRPDKVQALRHTSLAV